MTDTPRSKELKKRSGIADKLEKLVDDVRKGFEGQIDRTNEQLDFWDIYNCVLGRNQTYMGTSQIFLPIVQNAVDARKTRFLNQLFPQAGRYVDCVSDDGTIPHERIALAEHYIREMKLKTIAVPALLRNGDIEGQYNLYVTWNKATRYVASRQTEKAIVDGVIELDEEFGETQTIIEEEMRVEGPEVECIPDADVLVLPAIAPSVDKALEWGGSVTILRRWTKERIRELINDDEIDKQAGEALIESMTSAAKHGQKDVMKDHVDDAGIKEKGKYALVYEIWKRFKVDGKQKLCRVYTAGSDGALSVKRNPYWSDLCPLISHPISKVAGVFKGVSPIRSVASIQYGANDAINEAMDSAKYSLLPIVMTDPVANPRTATMVLDVAAIWECDPRSTQFANFPDNWKEAFTIVGWAQQEIFQTLSVSPSMIPQSSGGANKKRNQAEVAQEQQVDLLTTSEATSNLEEGILTPLVQRVMWLDHQYRDDDITVQAFGRMGLKASTQDVPPMQMDARFVYSWRGTEAQRNQQQVQAMIAGINVLRGIPKDMYENRKIDLTSVIEAFVEQVYGPKIAPLVFQDLEDELTVDPEQENQMLSQGFDLPVHPMDDDKKHIEVHQKLGPVAQGHILRHMHSMQIKMQQHQQQAAAAAQGGQGGPGQTPPGASPAGPRQNKGPPGTPATDAPTGDPGAMPRKM